MSDRHDDPGTRDDEDDWFALPGDDYSEPETIVWEDTEPPPPPPQRRGPSAGPWVAIAALVGAIALIVGGILLAQRLTDSDSEESSPPTTETAAPTATETTPTTPTTPTDTTPATTPTTPTTTNGETTVPQGVTLRPGDSGAEVQALQQALSQLGYDPGAIDGDYGPSTQAAVVAFQTAEGLSADGIAGPETLTALAAALATG